MRVINKFFMSLCAASMIAACGGSGGGDSAPPIANPGKSWRTAEMIETSPGNALVPQIAVDPNGNAIAVWQQFANGRGDIWANRYTKGVGWGTAQLIEVDDTGGAGGPQIVMDANGNVIAVWAQSDGTRSNVWANHYVPGIGWGTAQLIEMDDAGGAGGPQIAMNRDGVAMVVWPQSDSVRYNIWANRYVPNVGWGTAQLIETDDAGHANLPQVAVNSSGMTIAVWAHSDGTRDNIWANWYTPGTGWGTASVIEQSAGAALEPQVAIGADGSAIAVWRSWDGTRYNMAAKRYAPGAGWDANELAIEDSSDFIYVVAQIAMDVNGNAIAIWHQADETGSISIWANRYVAGTGWGTAELVETEPTGSAEFPQLAIDQRGDAMAVWNQYDPMQARDNVWANRYIVGSGWGTPWLIENEDAGDARYPQIALDADSNAIAVWTQHDGTYTSISANRYE